MAVASVTSPDRAVLARVYAAPAPQLRTTEAAKGGVQTKPAASRPNEEQVQPVKSPAKPAEPAADITAQATRYRVDKDSKRIVTQLIGQNNEVVRQIPPQDQLDISAKMKRLQGLLFDQRV